MSKNKFDYITFPTDKPPTVIGWGCSPKTVYLGQSDLPLESFVANILTQLGHTVWWHPEKWGDPVDNKPTHDPLNSYYLTRTCFVDPEIGIIGAASFRGHACLIDELYPASLTLANVRPAGLPTVARAWQPTLMQALFWIIQHGCGSTRHGDDGEKHARGIAMVLNLQWRVWQKANAKADDLLINGNPEAEPTIIDEIFGNVIKPGHVNDFEDAIRYALADVSKEHQRAIAPYDARFLLEQPSDHVTVFATLPHGKLRDALDKGVDIGYSGDHTMIKVIQVPHSDDRQTTEIDPDLYESLKRAVNEKLRDKSMAVAKMADVSKEGSSKLFANYELPRLDYSIRVWDGVADNSAKFGPFGLSLKDRQYMEMRQWAEDVAFRRESLGIVDSSANPEPPASLLGLGADQIIKDDPHGNE